MLLMILLLIRMVCTFACQGDISKACMKNKSFWLTLVQRNAEIAMEVFLCVHNNFVKDAGNFSTNLEQLYQSI